jgi:hypothetical protein
VNPERFFKAFKLPRPTSPERLRSVLPRELVLRTIEGVAIPAPRKHDAGCLFLESDGCRLSAAERPDQCLALVPALETLIAGEVHCQLKPEGSTLSAIRAWRDFWEQG